MASPLIQLKGIGKIYVSEGNVAVGIRGVDLSFDRGEFVAVTGASGSGKSTLLNVISGMDSYEEGEMYVEGEPTSHFMQKDWEEYRKKYISFIFQEYNIIESFTVLENVELALMNIENPLERREKAEELLRRVGLEKFMHHKGSKLSGGQKQRTVIARALAKDSPVILADEPTGNLDSKTSEEIINLLREVSRDKLVIIVTHNFEQVEHCATRHIRVFDGAVESDHVMVNTCVPATPMPEPEADKKSRVGENLRNGIALGLVRFRATPKLTVFLCLLMTLVALILTVITSRTEISGVITDKNYMFTHLTGRTVIVKADGSVMTEQELKDAAEKTGAVRYIRIDYMLDRTTALDVNQGYEWNARVDFNVDTLSEGMTLDGGVFPEALNEVVLCLPLQYKSVYGSGSGFEPFTVTRTGNGGDVSLLHVVGVSYYVDNTVTPRILYNEEGYRIVMSLAYYDECAENFKAHVTVPETSTVSGEQLEGDTQFIIDFDLAPGTYCVTAIDKYLKNADSPVDVVITGSFVSRTVRQESGWDYSATWTEYGDSVTVSGFPDGAARLGELPDSSKALLRSMGVDGTNIMVLVISPDMLENFLYEHYYNAAYNQASLFYGSDAEARAKTGKLQELGFVAVPSDETVEQDELARLQNVFGIVLTVVIWVAAVVFISMFMSLCTSRSMNATKGDIGIMRSMGIPTAVVKISVYVQTALALIPAFIVTTIACFIVYLTPKTSGYFPFLHTGEYLMLVGIMVCISAVLSRRYVKKMFTQSVKKTLKGGNKQ